MKDYKTQRLINELTHEYFNRKEDMDMMKNELRDVNLSTHDSEYLLMEMEHTEGVISGLKIALKVIEDIYPG